MRDINLNVIPEGVTAAWCRFRLRNRQEPLSAQNISDAVILAEYFSDSIDKLQQDLMDNKEHIATAIQATKEELSGMQSLLDAQAKLQAQGRAVRDAVVVRRAGKAASVTTSDN